MVLKVRVMKYSQAINRHKTLMHEYKQLLLLVNKQSRNGPVVKSEPLIIGVYAQVRTAALMRTKICFFTVSIMRACASANSSLASMITV